MTGFEPVYRLESKTLVKICSDAVFCVGLGAAFAQITATQHSSLNVSANAMTKITLGEAPEDDNKVIGLSV